MPVDFLKVGRFEMMRIRIIGGVVVNGAPQSVGDVIDVQPHDGLMLIGMGRAEKYVEPEAQPEPEVKHEPGEFTKAVVESAKVRAGRKSAK